MPWKETQVTDQRWTFIQAWLTRRWTMTELCERFGISRKTGYKFVARFEAGGKPALADQRRAPRTCPHRTTAPVEAADCTPHAVVTTRAQDIAQAMTSSLDTSRPARSMGRVYRAPPATLQLPFAVLRHGEL